MDKWVWIGECRLKGEVYIGLKKDLFKYSPLTLVQEVFNKYQGIPTILIDAHVLYK